LVAFGIRDLGMLTCVLRILLGLGRVLLTLGVVIPAVRLGGGAMGLRCGLVMFRRFVVFVFHVVFSCGQLISTVTASDLNSVRTVWQLCH
jgi:hypothetical protein